MATKPKITLGLTIILITIFLIAIFFVIKAKNSSSFATITPQHNRFILEFNLSPKDEIALKESLGNLELPQNLINGASFELDSTSTAKLATVSPLKAKVKFNKNLIIFSGLTTRPFENEAHQPQTLKLPKSTNIAILNSSLEDFAHNKLNFPAKLVDWIKSNRQPNSLQYFFNFDKDQNIFIFENETPLEELKKLEDDNLTFKEDDQEDIKFFLLNMINSPNGQDQTLTIFNIDEFAYVATSPEAARTFISFKKSKQDSIDFPTKSEAKISYAILIKNNDDEITNTLMELILDAKPEVVSFLKNIDYFYLSLMPKAFSGLINIK